MEHDTDKIHNLILKNVYYLPAAPNILIIPQKCSRDRGGDKVGREVTYLKVMGKRSVLV